MLKQKIVRLVRGFLVIAIIAMTFASFSAHVYAATDSTVNFQARLMTNGGAIVPDGNYNVEFKLYNALTSSGSSQGSCNLDPACLWTETRTGANQVRVANGYLTVNLGSVTAFPTTINWDQDLYLGMNIGGTGTASWDGEMSPRLHLTAVPYAFRAGQLAQFNSSNSKTATLSFTAPTANDAIVLPDASGTVCLQSSAACGFALSSGSGSYIQNGTITQAANFNVQAATSGSVAGVLQANAAGSGDILDLENGAGTVIASFGSTGSVLHKTTTNATTAFQIQNASGSSIFNVDTTNSRIGINTTSPTEAADVVGNIQVKDASSPTKEYRLRTSGSQLDFEGAGANLVISVWSAVNYSGTQYNQLTLHNDGSAITTARSLYISAASGSSTDIFQANSQGGSNTFKINNNGDTWLQGVAGSYNAFRVSNASGVKLLGVDTNSSIVSLGNASTTAGQNLAGTLTFADGTVDGFTSSLNTATITANRTVSLPDATGTICLQNATACGFAPATGSTNYIRNTTVVQAANFNVQAASSGSVAGVLQANAAGSGDILDLKDGSGNIIGSFGSSGNVLLQPSTASTNAFAINSPISGSNENVFRVDTSSERVAIGVISGTPNAKLNIATSTTVAFRAYEGNASYDALELANPTTDIMDVSETGTTIHRTTTNSSTAFQIQNSSSTAIFGADTAVGMTLINTTPANEAASLTLSGGLTILSLPAPTGLAATVVGTAGSTTYSYQVVACDDSICTRSTVASNTATVTTGNATLSSTNYNQLTWNPVQGAAEYWIYRIAGGPTGVIGNVAAGTTTYNDIGSFAFGGLPSTTSTSGGITTAGSVTIGKNLTVNGTTTTANEVINNLNGTAVGTIFQVGGNSGNASYPSTVDIQGGINVEQLGTPSSPSVSVTGTGSTTYSYYIAACSTFCGSAFGINAGAQGTASGASSSVNNAATLNSTTNYNTVTWTAINGAAGYAVYQNKGGTINLLTVLSGATSYVDNGAAALVSNTSLPSRNNTGNIYGFGLNINTIDAQYNTTTLNIGSSTGYATTIKLNVATTVTGNLTQSGGTVSLAATGTGSVTATGALTLTAGAASTWGTSAGSLTIQPANANDLNLNVSGGGNINYTLTGTGNITMKYATKVVMQSTTNNTSAFQVQNAAGNGLFNIDTVNATTTIQGVASQAADMFDVKDSTGNIYIAVGSTGTVTLGNSAVGAMTLASGSFEPILSAAARHQKSVVLTPEYAGAVLDASNDATCSATSTGTMISSLDLTNRTNYYKWTTSQATNQCYDVVVQFEVPSDWAAWNGAPTVGAYTSDLTNGTIKLEVRDTSGVVETNNNFASVTPTATTTWQTKAGGTLTGTYAAGNVMTIRLRMTSPTSGDVRIGNITLNYFSKY